MENRSALSIRPEQQERSLFLFVVVVGYIVTFTVASRGGTHYSALQLVLGLAFGALYLILGVFEREIFQRFPARTGSALFFSLQIGLVLGIGWLLGPGGHWLIGLPMVGVAVEKLSGFWRWPVYAGLLAAIALPIAHYSTWDIVVMNVFIISTAIFFVILLTQFRLNEQRARRTAEDLSAQLEMANRRLVEYASQAEDLAAAQERNRLAREIHDNLGHYLTVVNVQIEAANALLDSEPPRAREALQKAHEVVKKGLRAVRESVSALRVSPVENRSLSEALAELVEETRACGLAAELCLLGEPRPVDQKTALALYRTAQEGLTNVCRHARAEWVQVELDLSSSDTVRLRVRDNGIGAADTCGGFGLVGIRERIHLLGGEIRVETRPGKGFLLEVVLPMAEERK